MPDPNVTLGVREVAQDVRAIDIDGDLTGSAENALMDAYVRANAKGVGAVILNFAKLDYMNSTGIGLLVTLLIRVNRQKQKLFAVGLTEHYRQIFDLTRLNEAILVFETEKDAIGAARRR